MNNLFDQIPEFRQAFKMILEDKMVSDGYFDGSRYIRSNEIRDTMYRNLKNKQSNYYKLFKEGNPYPKGPDNISSCWYRYLGLQENESYISKNNSLNFVEADAIVFWVLRCYGKSEERSEFLKKILTSVKRFHNISVNANIVKNLIYNKEKVNPIFIESYGDFINHISTFVQDDQIKLYYRGHSNANYKLIPSLFREERWINCEDKLYRELHKECSDHFERLKTSFKKLVDMQHYSLPTRLLDITELSNIALYFASESNFDYHGEVIVLNSSQTVRINPDDDITYLLSNLSKLKYSVKREIYSAITDSTIQSEHFNQKLKPLISEVQKEHSTFCYEPTKDDIKNYYIVDADWTNERIKSQSGAFVLCGLMDKDLKKHNLNPVRYTVNEKMIVLIVVNESKKKILKELERNGVYHSKLFPGVESTAIYLKNKFLQE